MQKLKSFAWFIASVVIAAPLLAQAAQGQGADQPQPVTVPAPNPAAAAAGAGAGELPPADLAFTPGVSEQDAATLIARMLKVNNPWLRPAPAEGIYSLRRTILNRTDDTGPFSLSQAGSAANRVGSIVQTPLHAMARKNAAYTVTPVGKARWNDLDLVAVDVKFDPPVRNGVGMGGQKTGQGTTSYASSSYEVGTARIVIDSARAIPLTISSPYRSTGSVTWQFDPQFAKLGDGLVPQRFQWTDPKYFREQQEFQIVSDTWLFSHGQSWPLGAALSSPAGGVKVEMVNLQLTTPAAPPATPTTTPARP